MTETVPEKPLYGSVEQYAELLSREPGRAEYLDLRALAVIKMIVRDHALSDALRVERIANVVAAVELIEGEAEPESEMVDVDRLPDCSDACAEDGGPHLDNCPRRIALSGMLR